MKFKTNAKCAGCEAAIRIKLNNVISSSDWKLDLDSPDKELTVTADVSPEAIIDALAEAGIRAEKID